jgi:Fungal specific transcription factor domain
MIPKDRFLGMQNNENNKEETKSLIYAVWMYGAMFSESHGRLEDICYQHSRRHFGETELSEDGGDLLSIDAAQACLLIALYEFKRMYFTRAWLSTTRALRIVQMMRLHQLDGPTLASQGLVGQASDEERRRVFWVAFALDRLSNNGTDWPMTLDESEVSLHPPFASPSFKQAHLLPSKLSADPLVE